MSGTDVDRVEGAISGAKAAGACPLCGGGFAEPLPRYSSPPWQLARCTDCCFVYLRNPPAYEDLITDFAWEKTSAIETKRRQRSRPLLMWLDQKTRWRLHLQRRSRHDFYSGLFRPGRVLDIGCATGAGVPEPFIPYGIEISRALFEQAKGVMAARGGEAVHGGAAEAIATFPPKFFTGVILSSVLEHEKQPKTLLAHVARVLDDDGKAFVRVPNFGGANRAINGAKWCGFRYPDHVNYFTVATLKRMASDCGLKVRLLNPIRLPFDDNINAVLSKL